MISHITYCNNNSFLAFFRKILWELQFNSLISEHHYLGYTQPVGEHLKYMAFANSHPIACLAWSSAPWYIGARDRFIGWSPETRQRNLPLPGVAMGQGSSFSLAFAGIKPTSRVSGLGKRL